MTASVPAAASIALTGDLAWTSLDGEPVFAEPWQGRVFGLAMDVVERSGLGWETFRRQLIAAITDDPDRPYYASWTVALEQMVVGASLIEPDDVEHHRVDAASYRYVDESHRDIEVFPIDATAGNVAATLVEHLRVADDDMSRWRQVELYRVWARGAPSAWGFRAFDDDGGTAIELELATSAGDAGQGNWDALRRDLLHIGPAI